MTNVCTDTRERMVELHDGRRVSNYSEEWRAECEARAVLRMPTKMHRRGYLLRVKEKRGQAAANALERHVMKLWEAEREIQQWAG